jgi:serine/threonine protein kinase/WD40 repeat protein
MAIATITSLVDALRQYRLLEAAQVEEVNSLQARFADSKMLAKELIQRGWLTPYQANQVLQGKGHELLLGSYLLLERLGEGGMGQVFKAKNWKLGRVVALKLIRKERLNNPDAIRRFEREVRSAAALSHPNIVLAHDADEIGGTHLLVMEYVEGTDLAKLVKKNGPLAVVDACEYIRQAALGLQHACERGMVHRDIKPANLLLTAVGRTVKILDMGLARLDEPAGDDDRSSTMTQEGMVMGTPDYIAPEQALQSHTVDIRGDIYSLGCTFYFLLTGRVPFAGGSLTEKLLKHQMSEPRALEEVRPDAPPGVAQVVRRMMAKKPADRYQTPAELATALALGFRPVKAPAGEVDRTIAVGRQAVPVVEASADTLNTPFGSLATDKPEAVSSPQRQRQGTEGSVPARSPAKGGRGLRFAALALLFLAVTFGGFLVVLMATDRGEIEIQTDDPTVAVVIRQSGKVVEIVDLKSKRKAVLRSGEYTVSLAGDPQGLKIDLPSTLTLRRGDKKVVSVRRLLPPAKPELLLPPAKPELLHSIEWQDAEQGFPAHITQTGVSGDGKLFFGAGDAGPSGTIRIFEVATGKQVQRLLPGLTAWFSNAAFVPGGKYLAAAYSLDKDLYLWDVATGKVVRKFPGHAEGGNGLAVSPDGKRILSWGSDKTIRLWDLETGKELRKLEGHTDTATGVFSPDGKKVLTFSPDKTLRLWDADTGKQLQKLQGHDDACYGSFSPDGKQALSWSPDKTLRLWNLESGKEIRRFEGPRAGIPSAGFVAGGRQVVAYCYDQTFRVWETASGKLVREIDLTEMGGDRWTMTASPDGRLALVNHEDGSVRVFDLATGKQIHRYDNCPKARSFSFSPDGQYAVAGTFRTKLFVFRLPGKNLVKP